jgi:uracil-DNA glycosylase
LRRPVFTCEHPEPVAPVTRHRGKARRLARLRARIVRDLYLAEWCEVWFFPRLAAVQGWQGTLDIMFIGLNPSLGHFPSAGDQLLYRHLARNGFARAHLTDVIKERAAGLAVSRIERDAERMRRYRRYLLAEIAIIRPRLIVAMGDRARDILTKCWLRSDPRLRHLPHYAARFPTPATRRRFGAELARIRRDYVRASRRADATRG